MRSDHDTTAQAAGGLSPAMRRTASFLAVGAGLLLLGGWLNIRPTLRQRALVGEEEQAKVLFPELADASKASSLEIVSFDDLVANGNMNAAKAAGKVRMEGKEYVMRDGDVVEFRFNV